VALHTCLPGYKNHIESGHDITLAINLFIKEVTLGLAFLTLEDYYTNIRIKGQNLGLLIIVITNLKSRAQNMNSLNCLPHISSVIFIEYLVLRIHQDCPLHGNPSVTVCQLPRTGVMKEVFLERSNLQHQMEKMLC